MWLFPIFYSVPNNGYVIYIQFPGSFVESQNTDPAGTPMVLDSASNYFIVASKDCIEDNECARHTAHGGQHGSMASTNSNIGYTPSKSSTFLQKTDMNMLSLKVNVSVYQDSVLLPAVSGRSAKNDKRISWISVPNVAVGAAETMNGTDSNIFGLGCMARMEEARKRKLQTEQFHLRARSIPDPSMDRTDEFSSSSERPADAALNHVRLQQYEDEYTPPFNESINTKHQWGVLSSSPTLPSSTVKSSPFPEWGPRVSLSEIRQRPLGFTSHPYGFAQTVTGDFFSTDSDKSDVSYNTTGSGDTTSPEKSGCSSLSSSSSSSYNLGDILRERQKQAQKNDNDPQKLYKSPQEQSQPWDLYDKIPSEVSWKNRYADYHPTAHYQLPQRSPYRRGAAADMYARQQFHGDPVPRSYLEYMYGDATFSPYARLWSTSDTSPESFQPRETPYLAMREIPLSQWTKQAETVQDLRKQESPLYTVHGIPLRAYSSEKTSTPTKANKQHPQIDDQDQRQEQHQGRYFEHALDALLDLIEPEQSVWGIQVGRLQNGKQGTLYVGDRRLQTQSRHKRQNVAYIPLPLNFPYNTSYLVELRNIWINRSPFQGRLPRYCIFDTGALHTHFPPVSRPALEHAGIPTAKDGTVYRSNLRSPHFDIHLEFQNGQTLRLPSPRQDDEKGVYDRILVTSFEELNTFPMDKGPTMIVGLLWMQHKTIEYDIYDQSISIAPAT